MEIEKSKVLIQFILIFRHSGDVLFFLYARRLRGYTATVAFFILNTFYRNASLTNSSVEMLFTLNENLSFFMQETGHCYLTSFYFIHISAKHFRK